MDTAATNSNDAVSPEQAAKAVILRECERLASAGITFVAIHFDGSGDSGATEEVRCYDSDWYAYDESEPVDHDASHLQEHFETLVPLRLRERLRRFWRCNSGCSRPQAHD